MKKEEIERFHGALRDTHLATIDVLIKEYIEKKVSPIIILNEGLIGAMGIIGDEFKARQVWVPQLLLAARNMSRGIEILKPSFLGNKLEPKSKLVIGTVKGDIHDIGKNLVTTMMTGAGYEVVDLGIDGPRRAVLGGYFQGTSRSCRFFRSSDDNHARNEEFNKSHTAELFQPPENHCGRSPGHPEVRW